MTELPDEDDIRDWAAIASSDQVSNSNDMAHAALNELEPYLDVIAMRDTGELYAYQDGVWKDDGEQVLRELLSDYMGTDYSPSVLSNAKELIRANWAVPRDEFGVPEGKLPLQNGLLDVRTRDLDPINPKDYITAQLPIEYDSDAECFFFKDFLDTVVPEEEKQRKLQEFIGYCLLPTVPYKKALMLLGPTNTAKSTFLRGVEQLLRPDDLAHVSPHKLQNSNHTAANLEHKMVNVVDELDNHDIDNTSVIKEAISGDPMSANPKYVQPYRFTPTCKHIYASNKSLEASMREVAFWDRWLTVMFEEQIPRDERIGKDEMLRRFEDEKAGILNWALDGLDRLLQRNKFTGARSAEETHALWTGFGDIVSQFIDEVLVPNPNTHVLAEELHNQYLNFCDRIGRDPTRSQYQLTEELKEKEVGEPTDGLWDPEEKQSKTGFEGITIRSEFESDDNDEVRNI